MDFRRVTAALLAAPLVGLLLGAMPTAQAAPNPKLTMTAISLNKPSVAVSGLNTVPVRSRSTVGTTRPIRSDEALTFYAILRAHGWHRAADVPVLDGPAADGRHGAERHLERADQRALHGERHVQGHRCVHRVRSSRSSGDMTDPTPFNGPTLAVTGPHLPKLSAAVSPKVVPFGSSYSIRWAVIDAADRQAVRDPHPGVPRQRQRVCRTRARITGPDRHERDRDQAVHGGGGRLRQLPADASVLRPTRPGSD